MEPGWWRGGVGVGGMWVVSDVVEKGKCEAAGRAGKELASRAYRAS